MKKLVALLLTLEISTILCCTSVAQQLTLPQLVKLSRLEPEEINDYLLSRGWKFEGVPSYKLNDATPIAEWRFKSTKYPAYNRVTNT